MPDTATTYLLAAIRAAGGPVYTSDAARMLAASGRSCHRNTARKKIRTLTRAGHLTALMDDAGRRVYELTAGPEVHR